jgi:hypothetical protein
MKDSKTGAEPYGFLGRAFGVVILLTTALCVWLSIPAYLYYWPAESLLEEPDAIILPFLLLIGYATLCWVYLLGGTALRGLQSVVTWCSAICLLFGIGQAAYLVEVVRAGMAFDRWAWGAAFTVSLLVWALSALVHASDVLEERADRWRADRSLGSNAG